jgi:hypothetical protein
VLLVRIVDYYFTAMFKSGVNKTSGSPMLFYRSVKEKNVTELLHEPRCEDPVNFLAFL